MPKYVRPGIIRVNIDLPEEDWNSFPDGTRARIVRNLVHAAKEFLENSTGDAFMDLDRGSFQIVPGPEK